MQLITESALRAGWFPSMVHTRHDLTVMVKGTFRLRTGGTAELLPAEDQLFFAGDEPIDPEAPSSLRYEADAVPFKPKADLLLVGSCHAPGGKPTPQCLVKFAVGRKERTLAVIGDRVWKRGLLKHSSEPELFLKMPLTYERSYGGPEDEENPLGVGAGMKPERLPNIEDPADLIKSAKKDYRPVGFGPLDRTWKLRRGKLGTYDSRWLAERWPGYPKDFDWSHFNCAPPEMQVAYLAGDERIYLWNLHPTQGDYRCALPGLRPRCFLRTVPQEGAVLREVSLNLDTVWVDADSELLVLVWRGVTPVRSMDYEEFDLLYLVEEKLEDKLGSMMRYSSRLARLIATQEVELVEEEDEPEAADPTMLWSQMSMEMKIDLEQSGDEPDSSMLSLPLHLAMESDEEGGTSSVLDLPLFVDLAPELEVMPPPLEGEPTLFSPAMFADLEASLEPDATVVGPPPFVGELDKPAGAETTVEAESPLLPALEDGGAEAGEQAGDDGAVDADDAVIDDELQAQIDAANEKAEEKAKEGLPEEARKALDEDRGDDFLAVVMAPTGKTPEEAQQLIDESLDKQREAMREQGQDPALLGRLEVESSEPEIDVIEPEMTRAELEQRLGEGERSFKGRDFSGLDCSGLDLGGVDLSECRLDRANLDACSLVGANLTKATLKAASLLETTLSAAILSGAALVNVKGSGASFDGAILDGADLTLAELEGASFREASCPKALFTEAELSKACFDDADASGAAFERAELGEASLVAAIFDDANLTGAKLERCQAGQLSLRGADLSAVRLREASLVGADISEATLDGASFVDADLTEATLTGAHGESVDFEGATMRSLRAGGGCVLPKARLEWVQGAGSQWSEATLSGASFRFADLPRASFISADLSDAVLHAADLRQANLSKAKLVRTVMTEADLFQARFEQADLSRSNLMGACCFQAEFLDAQVDAVKVDGANLGGSKLAHLARRL